jgi:soluble lytic murein transglycosylase-like protein
VKRKILSVLIAHGFLLCIATAARANGAVPDYFNHGCALWDAPPTLAMAIADIESGFHPWAVNIQGKSHYMKSRESALALIRKASAQRKSYDVGLMQINSYWLDKLRLDPVDVLDPKINVIIGCWILSEELKRHGMNWKGIGAYHTPVNKYPARARAYAEKAMRAWEDYK